VLRCKSARAERLIEGLGCQYLLGDSIQIRSAGTLDTRCDRPGTGLQSGFASCLRTMSALPLSVIAAGQIHSGIRIFEASIACSARRAALPRYLGDPHFCPDVDFSWKRDRLV